MRSDNALPACESKPEGLLKLISDEVPHRFIAFILESDPLGTKYKDVYNFFTRVAIHTKRCEALHQESQVFRHSFGDSRFEKAQREAIASSSRPVDSTAMSSDKAVPTTTIEASTVKPQISYSRWTPRAQPTHPVVAVMKTIYEGDNDENECTMRTPPTTVKVIQTINPLVSS